MALKGTLKDFGIADILQLIGQQQKTGILHLKSKDQLVEVYFRNGDIVRAKSATRKKKELLGELLVRSQLISQSQLDIALQNQKRTLQRLGDVLVASKMLTAQKLQQMVRLQTTETLNKLFTWKSGSYEFEQGEVQTELGDPLPLRAEAVLMEGFRMVDEWPVVRRVITSYQMTFEKVKELPAPPMAIDDVDDALESALAESKGRPARPTALDPLEVERQVFALVTSGRDVRRIIDVSCLGEFEACKALHNLVSQEYLRAVPPRGKSEGLGQERSWVDLANTALGRVLVTILVLIALGFVVSRVDVGSFRLARFPASHYAEPAAQRFISRHQVSRIRAAVEVYRLEHGEVPEQLEHLVQAGLLSSDDLSYPWREPYFYRRKDGGAFVLLPPLR